MSNLPSQKDAIAAALALYPTRPFAVSDIGSQTGWLKAASHDARNLYVSGPMGLATSVALGLAAVMTIQGVGASLSNVAASWLVTQGGYRLSHLAGAGVACAAPLMMLAFRRRIAPPAPTPEPGRPNPDA